MAALTDRVFHTGAMVWFGTLLLFGGLGWPPAAGAAAGGLLLAFMAVRGKFSQRAFAIAAAFCAAALSLSVYNARVAEPAKAYESTTLTLRGAVTGISRFSSEGGQVTLRLDGGNAPGLAGAAARVTVFSGLDVEIGDVVQCKLKPEAPGRAQRAGLWAKGLLLSGTGSIISAEPGAASALPEARLASYRQRLARAVTRQLTRDEGLVLSGMLLGDSSRVPAQIRRDYARTGISHLLAVSGLHLTVLTGMLGCLLSGGLFSRRQRTAVLMAAILGFMALTGFSPSVTRAGIMLLLTLCAGLLGRDPDSLNALGLAVILILLQNPYAAFSLSLQLSYLATLGIVCFSGPLAGWCSQTLLGEDPCELAESSPRLYAFLQALSLPFAAGILTAPLLCWQFGQLSLLSPLVNLLILPLEPAAIGCGLLCGAAGMVPQLELLSRVSGLAAGFAVQWINRIAGWWAQFPYAAVSITGGVAILWLAAATLVGALLWAQRAGRGLRWYAAALMAVSLLSGAFAQEAFSGGAMKVAAFYYGGPVAMAYGKQGAVIGVPSSAKAAEDIDDFLRDSGVERISLLVAQKDDELDSRAAQVLRERYVVDAALGLDKAPGFEAVLFGWVRVSAAGKAAHYVTVDAGPLRMAKAFRQQPVAADLLVNARGELIAAPGIRISVNSRYYHSDQFTVRRPN